MQISSSVEDLDAVVEYVLALTHRGELESKLADQAEFEEQYGRFAEPKQIFWVESADHFFAGALDAFEEIVLRAVSVPS